MQYFYNLFPNKEKKFLIFPKSFIQRANKLSDNPNIESIVKFIIFKKEITHLAL